MSNKLSKDAYGGVSGKDYVPYISGGSKSGGNGAVSPFSYSILVRISFIFSLLLFTRVYNSSNFLLFSFTRIKVFTKIYNIHTKNNINKIIKKIFNNTDPSYRIYYHPAIHKARNGKTKI